MKRIIALTIIATLPGLAQAHGNAAHNIMSNLPHFLSSPEHLWPLAVIAVILVSLKRLPGRLMSRIKIKS